MARAAARLRPLEQHEQRERARADARPATQGMCWGVLLAMGVGLGLGLCVLLTGLFVLAREEAPTARSSAPRAISSSTTTAADGHTGHSHGQASPARIEIGARHLSNLELEITASVAMNDSGQQLTRADVVAYTDMVAMPGSHGQGPLPMREVPNRPGVYTARAKVPMVGDYDVAVEVRQPVQARESQKVSVATVAPSGPKGG